MDYKLISKCFSPFKMNYLAKECCVLLILIFGLLQLNAQSKCRGVGDLRSYTISPSAIEIVFTAPPRPEEFLDDKNVPEYENSFIIDYQICLDSTHFNREFVYGLEEDYKTVAFGLSNTKTHGVTYILNEFPPYTWIYFSVYTDCGYSKSDRSYNLGKTNNDPPCKLLLLGEENGYYRFGFEFFPNT